MLQNKNLMFVILACLAGPAEAYVSINLSVQAYPNLVTVPNYPVYYVPGMRSNYFYYDGVYWVYEGDSWYASTWYNGRSSRLNQSYS